MRSVVEDIRLRNTLADLLCAYEALSRWSLRQRFVRKHFLMPSIERIRRILASGIETEGHDRETGHGAKQESPTAEGGDAQ
jgi:hypothetical protein